MAMNNKPFDNEPVFFTAQQYLDSINPERRRILNPQKLIDEAVQQDILRRDGDLLTYAGRGANRYL